MGCGCGWWVVSCGWELVEHFVIGPDTDTSWSRCSDHQSREWRRLRVEVNLPTIVTTPQQKATSPWARSHKAPSPHITDVRQPQEELQSSNENIDTSFKIAMHAHSSSMRFVRSPCKRSSQQTISRCGISAAKTFTTGGFQASRPPPFLLFLHWWYFQYIQTLEQYHFLSAGLRNG